MFYDPFHEEHCELEQPMLDEFLTENYADQVPIEEQVEQTETLDTVVESLDSQAESHVEVPEINIDVPTDQTFAESLDGQEDLGSEEFFGDGVSGADLVNELVSENFDEGGLENIELPEAGQTYETGTNKRKGYLDKSVFGDYGSYDGYGSGFDNTRSSSYKPRMRVEPPPRHRTRGTFGSKYWRKSDQNQGRIMNKDYLKNRNYK